MVELKEGDIPEGVVRIELINKGPDSFDMSLQCNQPEVGSFAFKLASQIVDTILSQTDGEVVRCTIGGEDITEEAKQAFDKSDESIH